MRLNWEEECAVDDLVLALGLGDSVRANEALDRLADRREELRDRIAVARSRVARRIAA